MVQSILQLIYVVIHVYETKWSFDTFYMLSGSKHDDMKKGFKHNRCSPKANSKIICFYFKQQTNFLVSYNDSYRCSRVCSPFERGQSGRHSADMLQVPASHFIVTNGWHNDTHVRYHDVDLSKMSLFWVKAYYSFWPSAPKVSQTERLACRVQGSN
jgi:hypothetical protein